MGREGRRDQTGRRNFPLHPPGSVLPSGRFRPGGRIRASASHAPSSIARPDLYSLRGFAATVAGDWLRALRWGREGLAVFGDEWPLDGLAEAKEAETAAVTGAGR